ncbi:hypothetical protein BJX62DRAFT_25022 [Aspergillus germanicus]
MRSLPCPCSRATTLAISRLAHQLATGQSAYLWRTALATVESRNSLAAVPTSKLDQREQQTVKSLKPRMPPLRFSECQNCAALRDTAANFFSLASSLALAADLAVMCDSHKALAADDEILGFLMTPFSHSILREIACVSIPGRRQGILLSARHRTRSPPGQQRSLAYSAYYRSSSGDSGELRPIQPRKAI